MRKEFLFVIAFLTSITVFSQKDTKVCLDTYGTSFNSSCSQIKDPGYLWSEMMLSLNSINKETVQSRIYKTKEVAVVLLPPMYTIQ